MDGLLSCNRYCGVAPGVGVCRRTGRRSPVLSRVARRSWDENRRGIQLWVGGRDGFSLMPYWSQYSTMAPAILAVPFWLSMVEYSTIDRLICGSVALDFDGSSGPFQSSDVADLAPSEVSSPC